MVKIFKEHTREKSKAQVLLKKKKTYAEFRKPLSPPELCPSLKVKDFPKAWALELFSPQTLLIQLAYEMWYLILDLILYLFTWLQLMSQK